MSKLEVDLLEQIQAAGLPEPVCQFRFAPPRRWRLDFWFPEQRLAVEVDGGTWLPGGGRHNRGAGYQSGCDKSNQAVVRGIYVLRFTARDVASGAALRLLRQILEESDD